MAEAKCRKCGGTATGNTFTEASSKINHAVGLSRGIKCGSNYNCTIEIKDTKTPKPKVIPKEISKPKETSQEKPKEIPKVIPQEKPKPKETSQTKTTVSTKDNKTTK